MNDKWKGFWGFWRGVFSESDGTPSFSRVATSVIVGFALFWVTHLVLKNHALPEFVGISSFVTVLYGANVLKSIAASLGSKPPSA